MNTPKVGTGELIAGAGGIVLLIALFLPWYGVDLEVAGFSTEASANAWETLGFIDILLFVIALVAVAVPVARATGSLPPELPAPLVLLGAGALGLLLVLFRVIDIPGPDVPAVAGDTVDFGREIGLFVALVAAAAIAYGGWRANGGPPRSLASPGRT